MREILFRGKILDGNVWAVGYYERTPIRDFLISEPFIVSKLDGEVFHVNSETIGQYTGLKDKNGVKIFEGDIVAYKDLRMEHKGVIVFGKYEISPLDNEAVQYEDEKIIEMIDNQWFKEEFLDLLCWASNEIEVIGNVYDNPELLT